VPSYSIVPFAAEDNEVPEVNTRGALAVVPAAKVRLVIVGYKEVTTFPPLEPVT